MSGWEKIKWGSLSAAQWLLVALSVLAIVYLIWMFFSSGLKIGEMCRDNSDCRSNFCYYKDTRSMSYCTKPCSGNEECPEGWQCLRPPHFPENLFVCLHR